MLNLSISYIKKMMLVVEVNTRKPLRGEMRIFLVRDIIMLY